MEVKASFKYNGKYYFKGDEFEVKEKSILKELEYKNLINIPKGFDFEEAPSGENKNVKITEDEVNSMNFENLKITASNLNIKYSPNIKEETLKEKIITFINEGEVNE